MSQSSLSVVIDDVGTTQNHGHSIAQDPSASPKTHQIRLPLEARAKGLMRHEEPQTPLFIKTAERANSFRLFRQARN
jgi:hypothetical protein